jgi:hypothetical protein
VEGAHTKYQQEEHGGFADSDDRSKVLRKSHANHTGNEHGKPHVMSDMRRQHHEHRFADWLRREIRANEPQHQKKQHQKRKPGLYYINRYAVHRRRIIQLSSK